ncbi:MAG: CHAT domain-containing tetratricopeptide repeat protein [Prolixibacteraceae bacterium]
MKPSFFLKKNHLLPLMFCLLLLASFFASAQHPTPESDEDPYSLARQEYNNGSFDLALKLFSTSLRIRIIKNGSNSVPVANVLTNLGAIKIQFGSYDQAIDFYQKAATIYFNEGDEKLKQLASVQQNLAICFNQKGDFEKAKTYYENCERIFRALKVENSGDYENLVINQTLLYLDYNNLVIAEKFNNNAFNIKTSKKNEFIKWNNKGLIYFKKKNNAESIGCFEKALKVGHADFGENFTQGDLIHMNLGMVYLEMEDFDNSMRNYQIAKELIESTNGKQGVSYSSCLKDMGQNYLRKKENESNLEKFLVQRKKNIEIALDYFQKAIIAITPGFTSEDRAINPDPENAIDKTRLLDAFKNKADALYLLAQLEEKQENKEDNLKHMKLALATYDLSVKTIQLIRNGFQNQESRLFLAENEHPVFAEALEVAVDLYEKTNDKLYFDKGFEFSERSRSADFQSMLRELQAKEFSALPDSLLRKETDLKGDISTFDNLIFNEKSAPTPDMKKINLWKDKVFVLTQSYQEMISFVEKKYPRYYQYKYADPIVSVEKIQQSLDRREAFIEYFINEKRGTGELYTFVITDHAYSILRNPLNSGFSNTVDHFLQFIKNGMVLTTRKADYIRYTKDAYDLYKLLIEPVTPFMQNYRLVIVPDDKLAYLPFDAFLASAADTTRMDFRNLDYVVHHHAISYTYSATLLYFYFQNSRKFSNKIGAFAPDYSSESSLSGADDDHFLPLPGAEAEVAGLTTLLQGDQFSGTRATRQSFLQNAGNYDILHLAMHTILNDTLPLYSKMVFSPDPSGKDEKVLNTYEIYNLKLKSDMVVLSGCNTGSGKLQKGEGVMSLARAFLYAGCPSIIMTLWNVEDTSSSVLMIEFYKNIKNGYSKDEALRRAKVSYLEQADPMKAHPYFWLGYVSIGKQTSLFKTKAGYFVGLIIFVFLAIVLEKWYFKRKKRTNRLK